MTAALPVSVAPRPGESIESWLEHLADANGLTTAQLLATTGRGRAGTRFLTLTPYLPSADPLLYDLTPRADEEIGGEAATRLTLLLLRHARDDDLWATLCAHRPLFEALIAERGLGVAAAVLRYVLEAGRCGPSDEARMVIRETMGEAADDDLLRYGDQLRQEGAAHARRLLFISLRAGPYASLPEWAWDRLNEAALDELERWLTQAPDAETLLSLLAPAPRSSSSRAASLRRSQAQSGRLA